MFLIKLATTMMSAALALNVSLWPGQIPDSVIHDFEKTTGIHVNVHVHTNDELLYAQLAEHAMSDDVVSPSDVQRFIRDKLLQPFDDKQFHQPLDPHLKTYGMYHGQRFAIPHTWGVTGIAKHVTLPPITAWSDLWHPQWRHQLLLLDDMRDVIAMVQLTHPATHAVLLDRLLRLKPNVRLLSTDQIVHALITEEIMLGMAWNGDVLRAQQSNPNIAFIYPKEGSLVWVDYLAIPIGATHMTEAYRFINFVLSDRMAAKTTATFFFPTSNPRATRYLPIALKANSVLHPPWQHLYQRTEWSDHDRRLFATDWETFRLL
jgi:spermidine/putrescine transport system substrate-binding protein